MPLALLVAVPFLPVLANGFVDWDDPVNFLTNLDYRGLGWAQLRWAFGTYLLGVYQPLAWVFLEAQYQAWGLSPGGYHLASLLMHALNAVVLAALAATLLDRGLPDEVRGDRRAVVLGSATAAALYAVHPLRVEVVAWASCQPYLPCAFFCLLTVLAYLRGCEAAGRRRVAWIAGAWTLSLAALACKAAAVGLPAVLLILNVYPLRRLGIGPGLRAGPEARRVVLELAPFALAGVAFAVLAVSAKRADFSLTPSGAGGIESRLAQACYGIAFYPIKTIVPHGLAHYYPTPRRMDFSRAPYAPAAAAVACVTAAAAVFRRRWPGLAAVWACYLATLAPNLGLVRIGLQVAADRYSYLPMMCATVGLACVLSLVAHRVRGGLARYSAGALVLAMLLALMAMSWRQCQVWRDTESLWTQALRHAAARDGKAHFALASELQRQGRSGEAEVLRARAMELDPRIPDALANLGTALAKKGRLEEAIRFFDAALKVDPGHVIARNALGWSLEQQGRHAEAAREFEAVVRLDPSLVEAHINLALVYAKLGRLEDAEAQFVQALRYKPGDPMASSGLSQTIEERRNRAARP